MLVLSNAFLHVFTVQLAPWQPPVIGPVVDAYLGPNTVLPLASALAAGLGILLMFWRYIFATVRKALHAFKHDSQYEASGEVRDDAQN
jgi:hypothetical protein